MKKDNLILEKLTSFKRNNGKLFFYLNKTFFVVLLLVLFSCQKNPNEHAGNSSLKNQSANQEKTVWTDRDEAALEKLLQNFILIKDDATNNIWYSHKSIPELGTNLFCEVNGSENYCYLISMYYEKNKLFHESVQIKFDTCTVSTDIITNSDRRNRVNSYKKSTLETIHFTEGTDKEIPKLIALNFNKKISVTLASKENNYNYFLSDKMKKSIKDSYELMEMLKRKSFAQDKFK